MRPYYVADIVREAPRAWTLHGAWCHRERPGSPWRQIVLSGSETYREALASVLFHSNDQDAFRGMPEEAELFRAKRARDGFAEAAEWLRNREMDRYSKSEQLGASVT